MEFGICNLCVIPVRKQPSDKSEMISQYLFGETYAVIRKNGSWLMAKAYDDEYQGWIDIKQHNPLKKKEFDLINQNSGHMVFELTHAATVNDQKQVILLGSHLPCYDAMIFKMNKKKCI